MAQTSFIRFFNKNGEDYNFSPYVSEFGNAFEGAIFFPKVSVNLIESENIFLLQEVTLATATPQKRRLSGTATTISGSPFVNVADGKLTTEIAVDDIIEIDGIDYTIGSVNSDIICTLTSNASTNTTTTNFYLLDFVAYNELIQSSDVESETLVAEFVEETGNFFFYDINYQESVPLIEKKRTLEFPIPVGPTLIDSTTGRTIVSATSQNVTPLQLNIGFGATAEGIFEENFSLSLKKTKNFPGSSWNLLQENSDGTWKINIAYIGYLPEFQSVETIYLSRAVPGGGNQYFEMKLISVSETSSETKLVVKEINTKLLSTIAAGNINSFGVHLIWKERLLDTIAYAESESEDERFKLVLENFGRKIDEDKEYIFRDSDIHEELTDYRLLNKKRKELLLEGDKIYPYMGSYKALINVLNLFGYYDVEIKEYFLNVDTTSLDKGKFTSVPIAKSSAQNALVKKAWEVLPSQMYKKTSLFGLYYKLNKTTGEYDSEGLPIVTEDYQFTPEEVLVKLFGLKELLKKDYLPLNARIYDITGEGIYFERYKLDSWSDQVDIRVLDIGKLPELLLYPTATSYIRDLRYIDNYYKVKFTEQGLTGFLGPTSSTPGLTSTSTPLSSIINNPVGSFDDYEQGLWSYRDQFWDSMPPGISNPEFNLYASYTKALPDDNDMPIGAPVLIEAIFPLTWNECNFQWNQVGQIGATGANVNINLWTWDTVDRGEYVDAKIVAELTGTQSYRYDSGRRPLDEFAIDYTDTAGNTYKRILHAISLPFTGTYDISIYIYDATNNFTMQYLKKEVKTPEAHVTAAFQKQEIYDNVDDMNLKWKDAAFDWYYPAQPFTKWEDANLNWQTLEEYFYRDQVLTENKVLVDILEIDRVAASVLIQGDVTDNPLAITGEYLFFERNANSIIVDTATIPVGDLTRINSTDFTISYDPLNDDVQLYSKVLIKNTTNAFNTLSANDFFYADVINVNSSLSTLTLRGYSVSIDNFESTNASQALYWDSGFFAGTYAIEILSVKAVSGNTRFFLKDTMKELYRMDGYFQPYLTSYDVDFAETHIGLTADTYENSTDTTWNSLSEKSWWSKERHAVLNSGFLISKVAPGALVKISDFDDFYFSGTTILNQYGMTALNKGIEELLASTNDGIQTYDYELFPNTPLYVYDIVGATLATAATASGAATTVYVSSVPYTMKIPADITIGLSGTSLTFFATSGSGYITPPNVTLTGGGGTGASITLSIDSTGSVDGFTATGGTGYTSVPAYTIDKPTGFEDGLTNVFWTGREWSKVTQAVTYPDPFFTIENALVYPIPSGTELLSPYPWHKQQYELSPKILNDFYFGILATAKTPSLKNLDQVLFDNGSEGEWYDTPEASYSFPLGNSLLFKAENEDYRIPQYQYWESNNYSFPVGNANEDDSRALYAGAYSEGFSFADANITDKSFQITRSTSVVFTDDASRLPTKRKRTWKIINAKTGDEVVESNSEKLMWKFTQTGEFSVYLSITDKNGNISEITKQSFIEVV